MKSYPYHYKIHTVPTQMNMFETYPKNSLTNLIINNNMESGTYIVTYLSVQFVLPSTFGLEIFQSLFVYGIEFAKKYVFSILSIAMLCALIKWRCQPPFSKVIHNFQHNYIIKFPTSLVKNKYFCPHTCITLHKDYLFPMRYST